MAQNVENISPIAKMGARANNILKTNGEPQVTGLTARNGSAIPLMVNQTNAAATRAMEKKLLANAVAGGMDKATVNVNYNIEDDVKAVDEERRYRAAVTFMEWIVQTYDNDPFSMHVMYDKHPWLKDSVNQTITYWCDLVRKTAIAKLMPRTMWDEGVEDLMFRMFSMDPIQKESFLKFINSNPFFTQNYPQKDPIERGPFSPRKILNGVSDATRNANVSNFNRAAGITQFAPGADNNQYVNNTTSIADLFKIGRY